MKKDAMITIRLNGYLKLGLEEIAESYGCSVSSLVKVLLLYGRLLLHGDIEELTFNQIDEFLRYSGEV